MKSFKKGIKNNGILKVFESSNCNDINLCVSHDFRDHLIYHCTFNFH